MVHMGVLGGGETAECLCVCRLGVLKRQLHVIHEQRESV